MIGEIIDGKYEIIKLIGEGGMGAVYEATNLEDSTRCAVKVINDEEVAQDEVLITRFKREAKAAKRVRSEHIVEMLDAGHDDMTGHPYMVMEMLDGENALELVKRLGPLPPQLALRIGVQTCRGLAKAHKARVVHRDIKPANLFLARGEGDTITLKLLDFGVAKFKMDQASDTANESLTRTGSMLGSPMYMSPEQARGLKSIDDRADLWSLGVVMYQLLSGRVPLQDVEGLGELIISICSDPPSPVSEHAPWLSKEIDDVIAKALTLSRDERYRNADAFGTALSEHLDDQGADGWKIDRSMLVPLDEGLSKDASGDDGVVVKTGDGAKAEDATVALGPRKGAAAAEKPRAKPPLPPRAAARARVIEDAETIQPEDIEPADEASPPPAPKRGKSVKGKDAKGEDAKDEDAKDEDEAAEDEAAEDEDAKKDEAAEDEDGEEEGRFSEELSVVDDWAASPKEQAEAAVKEQDAIAKEQEAVALDDPIELPVPKPSRNLAKVVVGVVVGALLVIAFAMMAGDDETATTTPTASASAPAATATTTTPSATARATASSAVLQPEDAGAEDAAVAGEGARVQIVPKHAKVTVDGEEVVVEDGYIQISGEPGSEHVVILKVWGSTRMARVKLTPDGPKPNRVIFVAPRREDIYE